MDDKAEKIALFRYGLIAPLVLETLPRGELTRRAQEIAARLYDIPHSTRRRFPWTRCWTGRCVIAATDLPRLTPQTAPGSRSSRAPSTPQTAALIERLKRENPHRTGTALLRQLASSQRARAEAGAVSLHALSFPARSAASPNANCCSSKATAHKKYEAQFANQIWQSDMLFGPWVGRPGGGKRQVFLQATLDDASRLIPHAQFYPNQGLDSFLDCLRQAIAARGIPVAALHGQRQDLPLAAVGPHRRLHRHSHRAHASLSTRRPRQDRTLLPFRARTVSGLSSIPKSCCPSSNSTSTCGTGSTPFITAANTALCKPRRCCAGSAISNRSANCRPPPICAVSFFHRVDRLVRRDSTFLLHNRFFEAPPHLAGKRIEVRFDPLDLTQVEIYYEGKLKAWRVWWMRS